MKEQYLALLFRVNPDIIKEFIDEGGTPSESVVWNHIQSRVQRALHSEFRGEGMIEVSVEEWYDEPVEKPKGIIYTGSGRRSC